MTLCRLQGLDLNSASVNILAMVQANLLVHLSPSLSISLTCRALYSLFYVTMKLLSGESLTWCAR